MPIDHQAAAAAILAYQHDMGADWVLAPEPVDAFAEAIDIRQRKADAASKSHGTSSSSRSVQPNAQAPAQAFGQQGSDAAEDAIALARAAQSIDDISASLERYDGCGLKRMAENLCYCDGNRDARIMIIGEGPGREEDLQGKPFVGPAGQLLDRMLAAIQLDREQVFITNTVFWRPPGNRNPEQDELDACRPFLVRTVELVKPDLIFLLGNVATKYLFATKTGIMRMRGHWKTLELQGVTGNTLAIKTLPSLHPSYLLRQPPQKKLAWADLQALRKEIDGLAASG